MPTLLQFAIRSMDFILVAENKIMCVIVGTNGVVVNKVIETRFLFTRDELEKIGRYITAEFAGCTLDVIRRRLIRMTEEERAQHDAMLQKTISLGIDAVNDVAPFEHELYVEGAASILNKPEYADAASLRKTFLALQEKEKLVDILETCLRRRRLADPGRIGERLHTGAQLQYRRAALRHRLRAPRDGRHHRPDAHGVRAHGAAGRLPEPRAEPQDRRGTGASTT